MKKLALVALSVGGASGQYLEGLAVALSRRVETHLFVPRHYQGDTGAAVVHRFVTGRTRRRALFRLINPFPAREVWKRIMTVEPEVTHLFNGEGYPWGVWFSGWSQNVPFVVTVHDPEPHPGNRLEKINAWLRRITLRRAAAVQVHAAVFRDCMSSGRPDLPVFVIPHGSIAPRFLRHAAPGVEREPVVLFFGRVEKYKGIEYLVRAADLLAAEMKVVIAGPGRLPQEVRHTVSAHPARFEVHNRYLPDDEVARLFQRAAVCVLPYRQASQSSVPLIAAAFGVPVVATAVGAFVEDVPRVNGILVSPGDVPGLAWAIGEARGRTPFYPGDLDFSALADRFIRMYEDVAAGPRARDSAGKPGQEGE